MFSLGICLKLLQFLLFLLQLRLFCLYIHPRLFQTSQHFLIISSHLFKILGKIQELSKPFYGKKGIQIKMAALLIVVLNSLFQTGVLPLLCLLCLLQFLLCCGYLIIFCNNIVFDGFQIIAHLSKLIIQAVQFSFQSCLGRLHIINVAFRLLLLVFSRFFLIFCFFQFFPCFGGCKSIDV